MTTSAVTGRVAVQRTAVPNAHGRRSVVLFEVQTLVAEILAAWRRAERLASTLPPGSPEHAAAERACAQLRDLFGDLTTSGVVPALNEADARMLLAELAGSDADPRP